MACDETNECSCRVAERSGEVEEGPGRDDQRNAAFRAIEAVV